MDFEKGLFPAVKKSIEDFIQDEDGNITRSRLVTIGTMVMIMGIMLSIDAFAKHGSHRSHRSHASHSSTSYVRGSSVHESHASHASHASHTSHSNTASHSNSRYSAEGDVSYGPSVSSIPSVKAVPQSNTSIPVQSVRSMPSESAVITTPLPQIPRGMPVTEGTPQLSANGAQTVNMSIPIIPTAPDVPATIPIQQIQIPNLDVPIEITPEKTYGDVIEEGIGDFLNKD